MSGGARGLGVVYTTVHLGVAPGKVVFLRSKAEVRVAGFADDVRLPLNSAVVVALFEAPSLVRSDELVVTVLRGVFKSWRIFECQLCPDCWLATAEDFGNLEPPQALRTMILQSPVPNLRGQADPAAASS